MEHSELAKHDRQDVRVTLVYTGRLKDQDHDGTFSLDLASGPEQRVYFKARHASGIQRVQLFPPWWPPRDGDLLRAPNGSLYACGELNPPYYGSTWRLFPNRTSLLPLDESAFDPSCRYASPPDQWSLVYRAD